MPGGREGRRGEEVRPRRGARWPWRIGRRSACSPGRRRMAMADGQRRRALAGAEDDRGGRGRGGAPLPGRRTALAATGRRRASGRETSGRRGGPPSGKKAGACDGGRRHGRPRAMGEPLRLVPSQSRTRWGSPCFLLQQHGHGAAPAWPRLPGKPMLPLPSGI
jgi:hypothetical protein